MSPASFSRRLFGWPSEQVTGALSLAGDLLLWAVIFGLLAIFLRYLNFQTPLSGFLAQSIYTVYIFHFLVTYTVASMLPIQGDSGLFFLVVAGLTYAVTFVLHRLLISRHRVLRVMFNGKA